MALSSLEEAIFYWGLRPKHIIEHMSRCPVTFRAIEHVCKHKPYPQYLMPLLTSGTKDFMVEELQEPRLMDLLLTAETPPSSLCIQALLDLGVKPRYKDLVTAVELRSMKLIRLFLKAGVDPNEEQNGVQNNKQSDDDEQSKNVAYALFCNRYRGITVFGMKILRLLQAYGFDLKDANILMLAAHNTFPAKMIRAIIRAGGQITHPYLLLGKLHISALNYLIRRGVSVKGFVLQHFCELSKQGCKKSSKRYFEHIQCLIEAGAPCTYSEYVKHYPTLHTILLGALQAQESAMFVEQMEMIPVRVLKYLIESYLWSPGSPLKQNDL